MPKIDASGTAVINSIRVAEQDSAPAAPASGFGVIYEKTDGKVYFKNDAGTETEMAGGGAGTDAAAIHNNVAGEISAVSEKASPISADLILIEDSADSNNKKRVQIGNLPGGSGTDANAIHDNVANEISALTEKVTPVDADLLIIEDSEDTGAKKKVQIGNLPSGTGSGKQTIVFSVAGVVAAEAGVLRFPNHDGASRTILGVYLDINTAPTGAALIVDIHKSGTTIFTTQSNRPQIAAGAYGGSSTTIEVATWADGEYLTMSIDQVGSTVAGADLTVCIVYE